MPWKASCVVLALDPVAQRTEVVAEVDVAGRLDARQHAGHVAGHERTDATRDVERQPCCRNSHR